MVLKSQGSQCVKCGQERTRNPTEGVSWNVWKKSNRLPLCAEENLSSNRRLCQHSAISLARGLYTSVDTSTLSYRCCTTFRIEPLTIQLFEHMCIFHSTNRKNTAAGLQRSDPRARMREAEKVFLWEISVSFSCSFSLSDFIHWLYYTQAMGKMKSDWYCKWQVRPWNDFLSSSSGGVKPKAFCWFWRSWVILALICKNPLYSNSC